MARAKRTARAEARRRHRAEQGLPETLAGEEAPESSPGPRGRPTSPSAATPPVRMGMGEAFRRSFRPLDIRGDLAALPHLALRTKALWIPIALVIGSTALVYLVHALGSSATPDSLVTLVVQFVFAYFIQTPAIGGVFLAGFLAPRASWLLGVIVGLVSAACYGVLVLFAPQAIYEVAPTAAQAQEVVLSGLVLSPLMGAMFAAAAAWYRRFLQLSNPNRGRQQPAGKRGPDGRSRGANQRASVKR